MNDRLIIKYLNNQCTPEEAAEVLAWLKDRGATNTGRALIKKVWRDFQIDPRQESLDQERFLDKIHHEMNLRALSKHPSTAPVKRRLTYWLIRTAAVLFLPLLSLLLFTYASGNDPFVAFREVEPKWGEISTLAGGKAHFQLPDGTTVWLNFESRLRYPLAFLEEVREVELEGEAFFEVAEDADKPFRVKAGGLGVLATGTEFNVAAYPEDQIVEATLVSGAVTLEQMTSTGPKTLSNMAPGQHAVLRKDSNKLPIRNVEPSKYIAWREDKIVFEDDPIDQVFNRLSRWYNVEFELKNPKLAEYTYKATLIDETLPQVLELMELATPIESKIIPRQKQDDGTYSKSRVEIYLKE